MSLSNYSDINTAVAEWLNRVGFTDLTTRSPDFITMAQRRIQRVVRIPPMEVVTSLTVSATGEGTIPTDYLDTKYLIADNGDRAWSLERAPFWEVRSKQKLDGFEPEIYDTEGGKFYVGPFPLSGDTFELIYYRELEFISSTVSTNWFSLYAPELILFGAALEASNWMKDWEMADRYKGLFLESKDALEAQKRMSEYAGSPLTVKTR